MDDSDANRQHSYRCHDLFTRQQQYSCLSPAMKSAKQHSNTAAASYGIKFTRRSKCQRSFMSSPHPVKLLHSRGGKKARSRRALYAFQDTEFASVPYRKIIDKIFLLAQTVNTLYSMGKATILNSGLILHRLCLVPLGICTMVSSMTPYVLPFSS